jgi:RND family efflux transporter MFP subunit
VERGPIEYRRTFNGSLDAYAKLTVAPKIAGRVVRVAVDLGDPVPAGQELVVLDGDELRQAVALAQADLTVAQARLLETQSSVSTAERELARITQLHEQGLTSEAVLDATRSTQQAAAAAQQMAHGGLSRVKAELATARIRLGYTTIRAGELEGGGTRVVAQRHVDPGDTVAANTPLLSVVEIDPLVAAISVTEQDYSLIAVGQQASLTTDALPGQSFHAVVQRIAPAFEEASRQARVELRVDNAELQLKPGLFARVALVLGREESASIVPEAALTRRGERDGVFVVIDNGKRVVFRPVEIAIRDGARVQVRGEGITGRVVTLGQQLLDDGSAIAPQDRGAGAREPRSEHGEASERGNDG